MLRSLKRMSQNYEDTETMVCVSLHCSFKVERQQKTKAVGPLLNFAPYYRLHNYSADVKKRDKMC